MTKVNEVYCCLMQDGNQHNITLVDRLLGAVIQYFIFICCLAIHYTTHSTIYQIQRVIIYNFHCIDWPVEIASPGCCLRHHSSTPVLKSMLLSLAPNAPK